MSEARSVRDPIGRMSFGLVVVMVALLTPLTPLGPAVASASTDDPIFDFQNSLGCKAVSVSAGPFAPEITANHRFRPCQDDTEALLVFGAYVTRVPPDGQTSLTDDSTDVTVTVRDAFAKTALEPFVEATAEAHVGEFTLHHPGVGVLRVKAAESRASVTCTGASAAVMAGSSKVLSVQLNGFELLPTATSEPRVIDALSLKVALNQQSRSSDFTQTAVIVNVNTAGFGPSSEVRLGESKVGSHGGCDPSAPKISVGDVSVTEGDAGSANATFTVTLASPPPWDVTVNYATADATATAGSDYTATSGTLRFVPGGTLTHTVVVAVAGDNVPEPDEVFHLNLSNPTGSAYTDARAVATIVNDDIPPGLFHPLSSARIFAGPLLQEQQVDVLVAGSLKPDGTPSGVPATGVSAVSLAVTVTPPAGGGFADSFLTVWPTGKQRPGVSNLNWLGSDPASANAVKVGVGDAGKVSVYNQWGSAHVAIDVVGWYANEDATTSGARYQPLTPARVLDSRTPASGTLSCNPPNVGSPFTNDQTRILQVAGQGGVPAAGASAVALNVTVAPNPCDAAATLPTGALTVWPANEVQPTGTNLRYRAGQKLLSTLVVTKLAPDGTVKLRNQANGPTHVVVDVQGWYSTVAPTGGEAGRFVSLSAPARFLDTRNPLLLNLTGRSSPDKLMAPEIIDLQVTGQNEVPAEGVKAVVMNVTVTQPDADSFVTVWPTGTRIPLQSNQIPGQQVPGVSTLNFVANQTVPNLVVVPVGLDGKVSFYNAHGAIHVAADVVGWFAAT